MDGVTGSGALLRCWNDIGVWGNRSCAELPRVGHCRNCEVYSAGGNELLARAVPADYLDEWTELLANKKETVSAASTPYVIFRVGQSWLGLRAVVLREVMHCGIVRSVPHRRSEVLIGITAVRGEIYPCVSLHALIGESAANGPTTRVRFLVASYQGGDWVFPVDEVSGMHDVLETAIEQLPATLAHTNSAYTTGIAQCVDRAVGLLDEGFLFSAIKRRVA